MKLEAIETSVGGVEQSPSGDTRLLKKSEEVLGSHYQSYFDDPEKMGLCSGPNGWRNGCPGKALVYGAAIGAARGCGDRGCAG